MAWVKNVARKAEKKVFGSGGAKRRYGIGKGKGGFNFKNVLKDIESIKGMLNVEKKLVDRDVVTGAVGLVTGNAEGSMKLDVTPFIGQGVGESNRVGNSIKLTGMSFPMTFTQQGSTGGDRKLRVSLYKISSADDGVTPAEVHTQLYDINPITGLRDYNSPKNYRNSKTDGIKHVRTMNYFLKAPQNLGSTEKNVQNVRFNVKLQDLLRYNSNAQTLPTGTRYILIIIGNAGNASPSVASTIDTAIGQVNTGVETRVAQRIWYVDN